VKKGINVGFGLLLMGLIFGSCRKEDSITTDASAKLSFSTDTLFFDTVFSQFGQSVPVSVTKQLWVINKNSQGVKTNISIKGTANGSVKLNIDGRPTTSISGKEIRGNDSIVIFVQLYSNPGNDFIVVDQILFETNGNNQDVEIVGFGRDAHYHDAETWDSTVTSITWTNDKPHVIYNSILVEKGQTLTIQPGTKIYSHINSTLYIRGSLSVNGTPANPVVFSGDRLDLEYADIPGQWNGIRILPGSTGKIEGAILRNGFVGIEVDSAPVISTNPNLIVNQCIIHNMKAAGIVGYSASILAVNNLITDCGQFSFYGALGGNYQLYYNTLSNTNSSSGRQNAQLLLDNTPYDDGKGTVLKFELNYVLINNIIYGNIEEELLFNNDPNGNQASTVRDIRNNLLRTKLTQLNTNNNILNLDPQFENLDQYKYTLKAESPAKGKALPVTTVTVDLNGNSRNATNPTMGAIE
jgi:hypothetical protein